MQQGRCASKPSKVRRIVEAQYLVCVHRSSNATIWVSLVACTICACIRCIASCKDRVRVGEGGMKGEGGGRGCVPACSKYRTRFLIPIRAQKTYSTRSLGVLLAMIFFFHLLRKIGILLRVLPRKKKKRKSFEEICSVSRIDLFARLG